MSNIFDSGVRPSIDAYLDAKAKEVRDYGEYWSASSAGYCMRKVIFDRMKVTQTTVDSRKHRIFEVGHIFHGWIQGVTAAAGVSVEQETELQDEKLMIRGHIDDIIKIGDGHILYDYKTAHSRSFTYKKEKPMSYYHMMQLGTYLHMLRQKKEYKDLTEARILTISKDDLRMDEAQLIWNDGLEKTIVDYWTDLNGFWNAKKLPACTCANYEINGKSNIGFMADARYNPYFFQGEPCSLTWYKIWKEGKANDYLKEDK